MPLQVRLAGEDLVATVHSTWPRSSLNFLLNGCLLLVSLFLLIRLHMGMISHRAVAEVAEGRNRIRPPTTTHRLLHVRAYHLAR